MLRKIATFLLFVSFISSILFMSLVPTAAFAVLSMELTRGVAGAIPIAVVPFALPDKALPREQNISNVIGNDLQQSGRFKVYGENALKVFPNDARDVPTDYFRRLSIDHVVVGKVEPLGGDRYQVSFQLLDMYRGKGDESAVLGRKYTISGNELRSVAHHISDLIYQQITGVHGIFSTKLVYVVVQRVGNGQARYFLEVADQDGYNPRPLLVSSEPIMSPSWSPDGKQIAYVSFEKRKANIYLQNVATGGRQLLSDFPGINGAPAWSPDGKQLALVLSKSGAPNIYLMDIATRSLTQLTRDSYINTEPAWSPDGKSLLFTSNRSGGVQVYQLNLATRAISRVTFDGDYNARASFSGNGNQVAMIHRVSGIYNIGILDLDAGTTKVLGSSAADSASPSMAPNGSMILYDTVYGGRNVLAMVSADGRVQLRLPARNGEAQDPAWSPFL